MKYLGIDFGSKRVGVATSDDGGSLAFPHSVLENDKNLLSNIKNIFDKNKIDKIVIGESKDFQMKDNEIMKATKIFVEELKKELKCEVDYQAEFLTSVQVERDHYNFSEKNKKRGMEKVKGLDAKAATIILQSYLDSNKK